MKIETKYILERTSEPSEDRVNFRVLVDGSEVHRAFFTRECYGAWYVGETPSFIQTAEERGKYIKAAFKLFHEPTSSFTLEYEVGSPYTEEWFLKARSRELECARDDLSALKERMEHLPKMIGVLNEVLKKGYNEAARDLADNIEYYAYRIAQVMGNIKYACKPDSNGKITAKLY